MIEKLFDEIYMLQLFYQQVSKNFHNKKERYKRDFYIQHTVLLLFIIAIICYHYGKHRTKLINVLPY